MVASICPEIIEGGVAAGDGDSNDAREAQECHEIETTAVDGSSLHVPGEQLVDCQNDSSLGGEQSRDGESLTREEHLEKVREGRAHSV